MTSSCPASPPANHFHSSLFLTHLVVIAHRQHGDGNITERYLPSSQRLFILDSAGVLRLLDQASVNVNTKDVAALELPSLKGE